MAEDVPTAMSMGMPHSMTINGILNAPPEMPVAPAKNPMSAVMGMVIHRLTVY